jgi:4-diphosphocytidyl-2-C-methyl-D-erythritol kinase
MTAPAAHLVLAVPAAHVATAEIFAAPELTRSTPSAKIDVFSEGYGRNDLAAVTAAMFPQVADALRARNARMTGSGACVFTSFATRRGAEEAMAALPWSGETFLARTLARHPLASFAR